MAARSLATDAIPIRVVCPVCGQKLEAMGLLSTNACGGMDSDLLQRAGGEQPLKLSGIVCTRCCYAGFEEGFSERVSLTPAAKTRFRAGLRPPVAIRNTGRSLDVPTWVRFDLIAQRQVLMAEPDESIANTYLHCAWAVRLEADLSGLGISEAEGEQMDAILDRIDPEGYQAPAGSRENRVDRLLHDAMLLRRAVKTAPDELKRAMAFEAIRLFREHGEHELVEELLEQCKALLPSAQLVPLAKTIRQSMARERDYQRKALPLFTRLARAGLGEDPGVIQYLCGELNRRLGRPVEAMGWFDSAIARGSPDWIVELAVQQRGKATSADWATATRRHADRGQPVTHACRPIRARHAGFISRPFCRKAHHR